MMPFSQATIGAAYKAVFGVPHGCAGSATIKKAEGAERQRLDDERHHGGARHPGHPDLLDREVEERLA